MFSAKEHEAAFQRLREKMSEVKEISAQTANEWVKAGTAVLLDVREDPELMQASIDGAVHNPMSSFDFDNIPGGDGKKLIVLCAHGMRSYEVAAYLINEGKVDEAYSMEGGIVAWAGAGLPVDQG